ncbi:MAG TPA: DUF2190 family protein [Pirellulales bacterium]|nr:DUF2190 family protein [Pirellulales bacterium]
MNRSPRLLANGNIYPCRFVKVDGSNDDYGLQAGAGDPVIGISGTGTNYPPLTDQSVSAYHAQAGDPISLLGDGEEALLEAGGSFAAGAKLKSDSSGRGVALANSGLEEVGAVALEAAGASGQLVRVQVACNRNQYHS